MPLPSFPPSVSTTFEVTPQLPSSFEPTLQELRDWFTELRDSERVNHPVTPSDGEALVRFFERLWEISGKDLSLGTNQANVGHRLSQQYLGEFIFSSPHIKRCFEKPRGYPGDFIMMEGIHRITPAPDAMGKWVNDWFHKYYVPFQSAKNRTAMIQEFISQGMGNGVRRVMNVACGSAPEMYQFPEAAGLEQIVLLDQDPEAVQAGKQTVIDATGQSENVLPLHLPIRDLMKGKHSLEANSLDLIYSLGLYDYLDNRAAAGLNQVLWDLLAPGGMLVVGNFSCNHWGRFPMEHVSDWFLIFRTPADLRKLGSRIKEPRVMEVLTDETRLMHLLVLGK